MKEDCFAFNGKVKVKGHKCIVLTEMICEHSDECPFYKTKAQYKADARAAERKNKGVNQYVK